MLTPVRITIPEGKPLPRDSRGYTKRVHNGRTGYAMLQALDLTAPDGRIPVYSHIAAHPSYTIGFFASDELTPLN